MNADPRIHQLTQDDGADKAPQSTLQCSEAEAPVTIRTCLELDRALHQAEQHCTSRHPTVVSLCARGHRLEIGLGLPDSFVSVRRFKPTPGDSVITVGDVQAGGDAVFFFLGGPRTEIPRRNLLPAPKARKIVREFFETGSISARVRWQAL